MSVLERILVMGITGSGKSYQWLTIARSLKNTNAVFRCIDTDNDIDYMLGTQFQDLMPENGSNVYVIRACDWPEYKTAIRWFNKKMSKEEESKLDKNQLIAYKKPVNSNDWLIVDKINNAWSAVQDYFVDGVHQEDIGDYFLRIRKELKSKGDVGKSGQKMTSITLESIDGWKDWPVINKLYADFIKEIVYKSRCHVYAATDVDEIDKKEKDPEILSLFGDLRIKPAGQKKLGGQFHSIFLMIPGSNKRLITTIKDRADREHMKKVPLFNMFLQYLVAKAGWDNTMTEEEIEQEMITEEQ